VRIVIETVNHSKQRYCTCGDYWIDKKGTIQIRISKMDWKLQWLVIVHELVEIFLCLLRGIEFGDIDKYDIKFESDRNNGERGETDEPGDGIDSPYRDEHCISVGFERVLCGIAMIPWRIYENVVNNLVYRPEKK
jgi:hypothetical protein